MPSLSLNSAEMGVNNNYADLRSNPNQNDNPPTGSISELENAPGSYGTVFNQKAAENLDQGGYLLLNSNDYDYQLNGNNLVPASSQTNLTVDDPALQQLQINAENPTSAGGYYTLTTTGGLRLWQNQNMTGPIAASQLFNATQTKIIYVEGEAPQLGEGSIMLNWQKNATSAPQLMDTVYYNVWQIIGAQNVPGYGKYIYNVSLPSSISPNPNNFTAVGGTSSWFPPLASSSTQVQWNSGEDVGELTYNIGNGFSGQWNVNVVQVSIGTPIGENTSTPGTPQEWGVVPDNGTLLNSVEAGNEPTAHGLVWNAQVTLTGATSLDWGVSQIQFGFIQNGIGFQNDGTYADGTTLKSSLDGFITPSSPVVDYEAYDPNPPWAHGNTYTVNSSDGYTTSITEYDTPRDGPPVYSDQSGSWEANNTHALTYMTLSYSFNLYVSAQTLDNENNASSVYTEAAVGSWSFNGSGSVTVNSAAQTVSWTAGAGAGVTGFSSWTAVTTGNQPVTGGYSFNQLLGAPEQFLYAADADQPDLSTASAAVEPAAANQVSLQPAPAPAPRHGDVSSGGTTLVRLGQVQRRGMGSQQWSRSLAVMPRENVIHTSSFFDRSFVVAPVPWAEQGVPWYGPLSLGAI